jgi:hydroxypyruvate isomerase
MHDHGLDYLVNCSMLFGELPLLERPAAAKAAGFDAIEFWWPWPEQPVPDDAEVDAVDLCLMIEGQEGVTWLQWQAIARAWVAAEVLGLLGVSAPDSM